MSENSVLIEASPTDVWKVLADGWLYPLWVVGASRIRDVDPDWPQQGSRIYHSVGIWPGLIDDHTDVLASEEGKALRLRARAWPVGEVEVVITLAPAPDGRSEVTILEEPVAGPGRALPSAVTEPGVRWRNTETLHRLALLVEGRTHRTPEKQG